MKYFWTRYWPGYLKTLVYMLQNTEYHLGQYIRWYGRTDNFRRVMKRKQLDMTSKARLLLLMLRLGALALATFVVLGAVLFVSTGEYWLLSGTILLLFTAPFILAYGVIVPLFIGWLLIQKPRQAIIIKKANRVLASHPARRIAITGSFGKTTAKEILRSVLNEGLKVAATPGNMNTALGISRFAMQLDGNEDILIIELGEEKPGDVRKLARLARPEYAIITGINEAHLSSFKSLDRTIATIYEIEEFVASDKLYKNGESPLVHKHSNKSKLWFSKKGIMDWRVSHISTSVLGTEFVAKRGKEIVHAQTGLVGTHTVGVTVAAIAIASELGLSSKQIEAGLRKVQPFEHRMQPRPLHGAWILDDTYNGNSQGVQAGLEFLKTSGAVRRVYVTPGLVEQGDQTQAVHEAIGRQIAGSADVVVLMQNSVTAYIEAGLKKGKFKGQLIKTDDPLGFYTNLDQFVAAGDIVLMQNDWTDNYA